MAQMIEHWTPAGPVKSPADIPLDQITREEVRARAMVGDASALGLLGFATGTFTVSAIATGWFAAGDIPWTVPVLLVFAGIAQFIAGMWAFRRGDVFGGTAFGAFGAFNTTFAFWDLTMHPATLGGSAAAAPINGIWIACCSHWPEPTAFWRRRYSIMAISCSKQSAAGVASRPPSWLSTPPRPC